MFDELQLHHARRRYRRDRDFIRDLINEEVQEKLNDHERQFKKIAVVSDDPNWACEIRAEADHIKFGDELDFGKAGYDLVLHLGALARSGDVVGQLVQSRLALAADGALIACFIGGDSLVELRSVLLRAEAEISGGAHARVAPMIELADASELLQRTGFALPVVDHHLLNVEYDDLFALMRDLRDLGVTNPLSNRSKTFARRGVFARAAAIYADQFAGEAGGVRASFDLIYLTGYAPSVNQPKALARGSVAKQFGMDI